MQDVTKTAENLTEATAEAAPKRNFLSKILDGCCDEGIGNAVKKILNSTGEGMGNIPPRL